MSGRRHSSKCRRFIKADVIEPWDNYIPKDVLDDILPSIREECTVDGKLYSWPFLLDVIGSSWHSGITDKAGLPDAAPATWDEFLASSKKIVDSKAAPWGATFDCARLAFARADHPHHEHQGLYAGRTVRLHQRARHRGAEADEADHGVCRIPTSCSKALRTPASTERRTKSPSPRSASAYYFKYFNAPLRMAASWDDPKLLHLGPLPKFANGEGSTVFWTTGCALFKYGQNKEKAAEYIKALTYDPQIWKDSIVGTKSGHPGQLPPYKSIYADWNANKPDWMPPFVSLVRGQLDRAKAINNNLFGLQQFVIGKPIWETYLKGEEADPKVAMQKAMDAVAGRGEEGLSQSRTRTGAIGPPRPCLHGRDDARRRLRGSRRLILYGHGGSCRVSRMVVDLKPSVSSGIGRQLAVPARPRRLVLPAAGADLLHRLSGLADRPRALAELHGFPVPVQQTRPLGLVSTTTFRR